MPDVIHRTFEERLGSYRHDIFAIMAVLTVGVGPYLYGYSMEKQLFWPTSCVCITQQTFKTIADLDRNILNIL